MKRVFQVGVLAAIVALVGVMPAAAQSASTPLGSVTLKQRVKANGEVLPPGTYLIRLTPEEAKPAIGQTPGAERWVEFVKGGKVVGREVVTIVPDSDIAQIAEGPRPPKGGVRVDTLKGGEFIRIWINKNGNNYLIHLPPADKTS